MQGSFLVLSPLPAPGQAEEGKPAKGSAQEASAAAVPTAEERSAGDAIVGVFLLLFGFGCVGFCVYYWSAGS